MNLRAVLGLLLISSATATPLPAAAADYAALRRAADDFAAKEKPGFKLLRVELTASHEDKSLQIHDGEFHYFGPIDKLDHRIQGVTKRIGDMQMLRLIVLPAEGAKIRSAPYKLSIDEGAWSMTPAPKNILPPEEAVRRLNRQIPEDPYRRPRSGVRQDPNRRGLFELKLVQIGDPRTAGSRREFNWSGLSASFGFRGAQAEFFTRTGPLGKWIWWTVVEQERADPKASPQRAGTPRRVMEYIYIDALTGKAESHCHGADYKPISC